jgi:hypothetical protein
MHMPTSTKRTKTANELLAAIQRTPTETSDHSTLSGGDSARPAVATAETAGTGRVGKPVQFWLHEEDRKIIRELSAWLAGQGIRPTDSMVIRAALRVSRTGSDLLQAYKQAMELDARFKRKNHLGS